ncbi:MAG: hypothetical protein V4812_19120 [Pseudomonadota bacterium]
MQAARLSLFAAVALLGGCQLFDTAPESNPAAKLVRLQGELSSRDGQLLFRPCQEQRRFTLADDNSGLTQDIAGLGAGETTLFADLRGRLEANGQNGIDGQFRVVQRYRVQQGPGCEDPNFKRLTLHAGGADWRLDTSGRGLVLDRPGQEPLALPYLEEQLPDGRFNLSSEANNQRLELWVAPQRCVDPATGAVQHLSAELRLDGQVQRGCAYYGGARND